MSLGALIVECSNTNKPQTESAATKHVQRHMLNHTQATSTGAFPPKRKHLETTVKYARKRIRFESALCEGAGQHTALGSSSKYMCFAGGDYAFEMKYAHREYE